MDVVAMESQPIEEKKYLDELCNYASMLSLKAPILFVFLVVGPSILKHSTQILLRLTHKIRVIIGNYPDLWRNSSVH